MDKSKLIVIIGGIVFFGLVFGGTIFTLSQTDPDKSLVNSEDSE